MRTAVAWCLLLALSLPVGCSSRSAYVRDEADDDELVWAYKDGLRIVDGRNEPVAQGPTWDGLSERVDCVEQARAFAESAETDGTVGRILSWTGTGVLVGGLGISVTLGAASAGAALIAGPALLVLGGGVLISGSLASLGAASILWMWASHLTRSALPEAMDAMNVYNDLFLDEESCRDTQGSSR